jgi:hypothetical protein
MRKYIILLLVILNITVTSCFAASWVKIDDNNYIDKDSIKSYVDDNGYTDYNKRIFWTKYEGNGIYEDVEKVTNSDIEYGLSQYVIDYSNNTITTKAGITYDKMGKPISSYSYKDFQLMYESIAPNSNAELWAELVKKPRLLKKAYKIQQAQKSQK